MKIRSDGLKTSQRVFDVILKYKLEHDGISPTYRDLMRLARLNSTSAVSHQIDILVERNLIMEMDGATRSLMVVGGYQNYGG